ncbi:MAG: NDP-sugar synthase [Vulcanimicrobiaceae bacterium]
MKAMILAGGMSTRLYPLTKTVPKPLVPIAGEPNAGHIMRYLRSFGIDEVAINVHYLSEKIVEAFGDGSAYGVKLHYSHEDVLMGSAGGVKRLESFLGDDTFVVIGCDEVTDMRLDALLAFHKKREAIASIGLVHNDDVTQYGVVILDDDGRIVDFQEKPPLGTERSHLVNTGVYGFEPAIFDRIPAETFFDFGKNVFPELQRDNAPFYGMQMQGAYWRDIGTPDEYRGATRDVLGGKVRLLGASRVRGYPSDATLGHDVRIEGDVRIGANATLGAGARIIGPTVLGDDVEIGPSAHVENAIVWDGVRIGADARVRDSIVGLGYRIAPSADIAGKIVANEPEPEPVA